MSWLRVGLVVAATSLVVALLGPDLVAPGPAHTIIEPWTGMKLVAIPRGSFIMGSPVSEPGRGLDERQHAVTISRGFYMGAHEVTETEWAIVMNTRPSHFADCGPCPVERVNFFEVERFLSTLNARSTTLFFRLPTEAEWEYACRAGTTTAYSTGPALTPRQAAFNDQPGVMATGEASLVRSTKPVGSYRPNPWGLFDMHGNVWEWTNDWSAERADPDNQTTDSNRAASGTKRVIRGGSWFVDAKSARCAMRYSHAPQDGGFSLGFRVAADPIRQRGER